VTGAARTTPAEPLRPALLVDVQRRIESLYALPPEAPVTDFLIPADEAGEYPGDGSRTLVSEDGDGLSVGVVLEGEVTERLARRDPRERLDGDNLGAFCTAAEEVSHFLYLLYCARRERPVTRLELELQAEVDKYLVAALLLSVQNEGALSSRLRELLFRRYRIAGHVSPEGAARYRAASALAWRYCGYLESQLLRQARLEELSREARRFYRLAQREKLERIATLG
jgi:hypothetical protein